MLILLTVALVVLLWFLFILHHNDIMYPSVVLCIVYLLNIIFAVYNWDTWQLADYSWKATGLILLNIVAFSLVGIWVEKVLFAGKHYVKNESHNRKGDFQEIKISILVLILDFIFCMVVFGEYYSQICEMVGTKTNFTSQIYAFRQASNSNNVDTTMPFILRQCLKAVNIQGYFFCYILINNIIARKFRFSDVLLVFPAAFTCMYTILGGGRLGILVFAAFILIVSYILWHRKHGWNRNLSFKYARIGIISLCIMLPAFYLLQKVAGRSTTLDPIYYISVYVGGSLKLFELYLQSPAEPSAILGKESFVAINNFMSRFGNRSLKYVRHLEHRSMGDIFLGNVYSALRRYHHDFGFCGMLILVILFSFLFHYFYCKIKYSKARKATFPVLVYCFIFFAVPLFPIDDMFYSSVVSVGYLTEIILFYIMYLLLIKKKFKFWTRKYCFRRIDS